MAESAGAPLTLSASATIALLSMQVGGGELEVETEAPGSLRTSSTERGNPGSFKRPNSSRDSLRTS